MIGILEDFSGPVLVTAIEANLFELYRYWGTSTKTEFHDSPDMTWLITGVVHPFMNGVFHTKLALAAGVAEIYRITPVPEARRQGIGVALTLAPKQQTIN